ncbi:beta-lactam-binding protein [Bradyrhizobium macuxiense]|uniref:Beta-lactam-binding protein n=1 Tax=Bradyrhizobium macuxiense TaxID=1755647 RepID=A0A109JTP3_9BRAD|nr:beta-lactam-binding protein [Bradyrhizobium macuxiense]
MTALPAYADSAQPGTALLRDMVGFQGQIAFLHMNVPGMVLAVVRNGESIVVGYGERADGAGEPDGDTVIRVGSISKAFAGQVLASLAADGTVRLSDRLQDRLGWPNAVVPKKDGREITLLDLATHGSGLPREVALERDPQRPDFVSREMYKAALKDQELLFAPGTGLHYSNYAFDLLGEALSNSAGKPYSQLLQERVFAPAGLKDTAVRLNDAQKARLFQGHAPDGKAYPLTDVSDMQAAASGLFSTANDMVRWLKWHLDRFGRNDAETRTLDHATYRVRDGLDPVSGLDESGHMDAMGLGWVVMNPQGTRPLILQKAGGRQGTLSYIAFSPARGVGVFISINKFDFAAGTAMPAFANELISQLAPR